MPLSSCILWRGTTRCWRRVWKQAVRWTSYIGATAFFGLARSLLEEIWDVDSSVISPLRRSHTERFSKGAVAVTGVLRRL